MREGWLTDKGRAVSAKRDEGLGGRYMRRTVLSSVAWSQPLRRGKISYNRVGGGTRGCSLRVFRWWWWGAFSMK